MDLKFPIELDDSAKLITETNRDAGLNVNPDNSTHHYYFCIKMLLECADGGNLLLTSC